MNFIKIDSSKITDEVFKDYEKYDYKFSDKLKAELRKAFKGEVALEKFRPHKENSQALILQAAYDEDLQIPTCKEWSAILLAAESIKETGDTDYDKLLNNSDNGMLRNEMEITSTALFYTSEQKVPNYVINNVFTSREKVVILKWFPEEGNYITIKKEIPELGLPEYATTWSGVGSLKKGRICAVFRSFHRATHAKRHFDLFYGWRPLNSESGLASRVIKRK